MESEGDLQTIFARSVEARILTCKTCVGDRDGKADPAVRDSMPYGPLIFIVKEECKSHITKKMGTGFRSVVKNCKGIT